MPLLLPVIMCGGAGTRMWPESRESLPKQFLSLLGQLSTFQATAAMFADRSRFSPPLVISNDDYAFQVSSQLEAIGMEGEIILEPMRRDSGPAVAAAAEIAARRNPDAVVLVMAADHNIEDRAGLLARFETAAAVAAQGHIVTLGVPPNFPATGYGYIRPGRSLSQGARVVDAFVEKPDETTARRYLESGYLWNSGNFIFPAGLMRAEIERFEPEMAAAVAAAVAGAQRRGGFLRLAPDAFARAPRKSIDYAVMERTRCAAVLPIDVGWSDVGTWSAVRDLSPKDDSGNSVRGLGVVLHGSGVLLRSHERLTAVVGLDDVIVVATADAVLVAAVSHADKVKGLVDRLKADNRPEAQTHRRIHRPWGYRESADMGERHAVRRLLVRPRCAFAPAPSAAAKHWIVARGVAEVTLGDATIALDETQSVCVPPGAAHRLVNPGAEDLELIEVLTGLSPVADEELDVDEAFDRA